MSHPPNSKIPIQRLVRSSKLISHYFLVQFSDEYLKRRKNYAVAFEDRGLIPALLWVVLSIFSFPTGVLHNIWKDLLSHKIKVRTSIELWVLFGLVLLIFVAYCIGSLPLPLYLSAILLLIPIFKLFDLFHTLFHLLISWSAPQSASRSLILILIHYMKIVAAFASFYLFSQKISGVAMFWIHGTAAQINTFEAFHYSITAAYPLGGDITLNPEIFGIAVLNWLELLCIFIMVVIEIPRVVALSPRVKKR